MSIVQFPARPARLAQGEGCPPWCISSGAEEVDHCHSGERHLFVERDHDGEPSFAVSVRAVQLVPGMPTMVDLRAWQANDPGTPSSQVEPLLSPVEARNIARLLLQCADDAEGIGR